MRIGSRHDKMCGKITMCELPWADVIRYLGVVIIRGAKFKCSIDKAKRSFYRAVNGIFAKIGRLASEEVIISYVSTFEAKMFAYLLYALEVCNWTKELCSHWTLHLIDFLRSSLRINYGNCELLSSTLLKQRFEKCITSL